MSRTSGSRPLVGRDLNARAREAQALELRIQGYGQQEIAEQVGLSQSAVSRAIKRALSRQEAHDVETLRQVDTQRMEDLHKLAWKYAQKGDMRAAAVITRLLDRRARLFGMDAAPGSEGAAYHQYHAMVVICTTAEAEAVLRQATREVAEQVNWIAEHSALDRMVTYDVTSEIPTGGETNGYEQLEERALAQVRATIPVRNPQDSLFMRVIVLRDTACKHDRVWPL